MNLNKILLMLFLLSAASIASEDLDRISLKNGGVYYLTISQVDNWGVKSSNNQMCLYHVLSEISTKKSSVAKEISTLYPYLIVTVEVDSIYVINFDNFKTETLPKIKEHKRHELSLVYVESLKSIPNADIRFSLLPSVTSSVVQEFCYSSDWFFSLLDDRPIQTSGFSYGIGVRKEWHFFEASILLNYLLQTGFDERVIAKSINHESPFLSSKISVNSTKKLFISLSWNYYFNGIKVKEEFHNSLINAGVGIKF
ncbi:MAG: hypothetical protein HQ510_09080 [Candidatus Marinimicrobia bacterium]|nr:hypothetical protein [Candidatus Neomarinimicrobiota bacterium]